MCMEDIRLGRQTVTMEVPISLTNASQAFLERDLFRTVLILWPPPSGTTTFSINSPVVVDQGITVPSGSPPVVLNIKDHGDIVTRQWFAIHSAGGVRGTAHVGRLEVK